MNEVEKMKKKLLAILCGILSVCAVGAFAACSDTKDPEKPSAGTEEPAGGEESGFKPITDGGNFNASGDYE